MTRLEDLTAIALELHKGQVDKQGRYIKGIKTAGGMDGMLAREVKIADLRHNLSRLTPELESLRSRYEKALDTLGADGGTEGRP